MALGLYVLYHEPNLGPVLSSQDLGSLQVYIGPLKARLDASEASFVKRVEKAKNKQKDFFEGKIILEERGSSKSPSLIESLLSVFFEGLCSGALVGTINYLPLPRNHRTSLAICLLMPISGMVVV